MMDRRAAGRAKCRVSAPLLVNNSEVGVYFTPSPA